MIIQTRYRDLPWETIIQCYAPEWHTAKTRRIWEEERRGRPVMIEIPAVEQPNTCFVCSGPFFQVTMQNRGVCPHIAEIGD